MSRSSRKTKTAKGRLPKFLTRTRLLSGLAALLVLFGARPAARRLRRRNEFDLGSVETPSFVGARRSGAGDLGDNSGEEPYGAFPGAESGFGPGQSGVPGALG